VREQIKLLKHHAHFAGNAAAFVARRIYNLPVRFGFGKRFSVDNDFAAVDNFQLIQAAQKSTFATAAGPYNRNNFAFVNT